MDQQRRLLLFFTLSLTILIGWSQFVVPIFFPPPLRNVKNLAELLNTDGPVSALLPENVAPELSASPVGDPVPDAKPTIVRHEPRTVVIGSDDPKSDYFLQVQLTSLGGAVDSVRLNDERYPEVGQRGTPLTLIGHDPNVAQKTLALQLKAIDQQLGKETLETVHWEVIEATPAAAAFRFTAPDGSLTVTKRYRLDPVKLPTAGDLDSFRDASTAGYQLHLALQIENRARRPLEFQYSLRGPVGLPLEDPHNSSKHNDVRMGFLSAGDYVDHRTFTAAEAVQQEKAAAAAAKAAQKAGIVEASKIEVWKRPIQYLGVDTQYFTALVHPVGDQLKSPSIETSQAVVISERAEPKFADVSVLMTSPVRTLGPAGATDGSDRLLNEFVLYAGPKREALLAPLKAESVLDYGWFAPVVRLMLGIVHALHSLGLNYGLSIILLTCLVRAAMIPLTLHQAKSMEKMKELQPKIKALHEKYKENPESLSPEEMRQMQEVNLKMFAGCLPLFAQMPIFIALYRALQVSVDLRMAPLHMFGNWIDNLASPDAMFAFGFALPFVAWTEFNLLPILSIVLMQVNQKLTMPPPADEEQAMQYRMMNIMMYLMVVFFYRVPAGLCLYFIMSSVWGMTERLLMKRFAAAKSAGSSPPPAAGAPVPKPEPAPSKPSMFDGFRDKLRELQELADKEASARRDKNAGSGGNNGKSKKQRGRR
ncbi:MAG: membrane protein insertase YidC [Planctomycetaceae bacterium]|nr:membrane protein insertase YidC [Planctomycetaceae bacterium]